MSFSYFNFGRTASLFALAILSLLAFTTQLVTLVIQMVTGDQSSKRPVKQDLVLFSTVTPVAS